MDIVTFKKENIADVIDFEKGIKKIRRRLWVGD